MIESVAVIGAGAMGTSMIKHALDGGYEVYAYDVDPNARERASSLGARTVDTVGNAAKDADLSLIVVGTSEQVEEALFDEDGVLSTVDKGHVIAISSTISPEHTVELAELTAEFGCPLLDIPTCRGEEAANEGNLLVLGGGDAEIFEEIRPLLEQFAKPENVVHLGPVGSGQVAKMANNTLLWTCLVADYEVLRLARTYGLDLEQLRDTLARSSGDNRALRKWESLYTKWAHKDMAITMESAETKGVTMPLSGLVRQLIRELDTEEIDDLR